MYDVYLLIIKMPFTKFLVDPVISYKQLVFFELGFL